MNKNFYLKCTVFAMAVFFLGCSSNLVMSDKNNGSSQTVEAGKIIEIKLSGQLSTGFSWKWVNNDFFTQEDAPKRVPVDKKPGGRELTVFTLKAVKPGKTKLLFEYRREWEKKEKPEKEYFVDVVITEGKK